jgi:integrase/recombinase XerD
MNYTWQARGIGLLDDLGRQLQRVLRGVRQSSFATRARYSEASERFLVYLAESCRLRKLANIKQKHLDGYVDHLKQRGCGPRYIATELSAIRWLHRQIAGAKEDLESGQGSNSRYGLDETRSGVDRAWTDREFQAVLSRAHDSGRLDIANVLVAAWFMGLRINEAVSLRRHQVEALVRNMVLAITGKGGRQRVIPGSSVITDFFRGVIRDVPRGEYVFCPQNKTLPAFKAQIQAFLISIRESVQDPDRKATGQNLKPGDRAALTFHGTRHAFAQRTVKKLMQDGLPQEEAYRLTAELLGHGRVEILIVYLSSQACDMGRPLDEPKGSSPLPLAGEVAERDESRAAGGTAKAMTSPTRSHTLHQVGLPLGEPQASSMAGGRPRG